MAHTHPWPAIEQVESPSSATEVLEEEMRLYPDGESMRLCILGLNEMYKRTAIVQSFAKASRLLFLANLQGGLELGEVVDPRTQIDNEFYGGALFALHLVARSLPHDAQRTYAYNADYMNFGNGEDFGDRQAEMMQQAYEDMTDFRASLWENTFDILPEVLQERLYEAAIRVYEDGITVANPRFSEDTFMAGFVYAANVIDETLDEMPKSQLPM